MRINRGSDNPGFGEDFQAITRCGSRNTSYGTVDTQCGPRTPQILNEYIQPGVFVEIGVFGGANLLSVYDTCIEKDCRIIGIDPFDNINIFNGVEEINSDKYVIEEHRKIAKIRYIKLNKIIKTNNLKIRLIKETSWNYAKKFKESEITCLHIDGDHSYGGVTRDLELYWSKIAPGGVIVNDDWTWKCCRRAIEDFIYTHTQEITKHFSPAKNKHVIIKK